MHPNPIAETSNPLFPRVRDCMVAPRARRHAAEVRGTQALPDCFDGASKVQRDDERQFARAPCAYQPYPILKITALLPSLPCAYSRLATSPWLGLRANCRPTPALG